MKKYNPKEIHLTKYLFFTGKGGVGKTSIACATAIHFADLGKKVLLISTDPASNLQDVFQTNLTNKMMPIYGVDNLMIMNLDPLKSAEEYRESVIAPYLGVMPEAAIKNMEEQLSGSCTVEIAAFNEFTNFITDQEIENKYDHVIFDTAPTGHTLRFLQLPSAWSSFISESTHGASCLGQLAGLEDRKEIYHRAMETLSNEEKTTLVLVTRPEETPLLEAKRASGELNDLGICNQILIVNGILEGENDEISASIKEKQGRALENLPKLFSKHLIYFLPLRAYNMLGIDNIRAMFDGEDYKLIENEFKASKLSSLQNIIDDLYDKKKKVVFTMGKGGVGKTTIATAIALGLSKRGAKVHLATTDPAAHLKYFLDDKDGMTFSSIDEKYELKRYQEEVISQAKANGMNDDDLAYIEEDLRSPCTQEIAVFRAFAEIVDKAESEVVVIDTAPTGHTLLLLDSTQSYHHEVERSNGNIPESVRKLLPRLTDKTETEVIIVTLAEATPVYEATRLMEDLKRAGILANWWVINSSFYQIETRNDILKAKASAEIEWINKVYEVSNGNIALVKWSSNEIKGKKLLEL